MSRPDEPARGARPALSGGPASRDALAALLGLPRRGGAFGVTGVTLVEGRVEVDVAHGETETVVVLEERARSPERSFLAAGEVALWYRGPEIPEPLEALIRRASERWGDLSVAKLERLISRDPELAETRWLPRGPGAEEEGSDDAPSEDGPARRPAVGTWSEEGAYADFLALDVLDLLPWEAIEAESPFVRISHSDLECHCFMPREKPSNMNVVELPWIHARGGAGQGVKALERTLSTNLSELDVIMGCTPRAREVLDQALAEEPDRPIIFTNTCVPATTGEDVVSTLRRYQAKHDIAIIGHNRAAGDQDDDMLGPLLVERRLAAAARIRSEDRRGVNLVGLPRDAALAELEGLLGEAGIEVNAVLLPLLDPAEVDRFPAGELNVLFRASRRWEELFDQLRRGSDIPWVTPPAPYGPAGTRAFVVEVAEAVDRREAMEAAWDRVASPSVDEWARLADRARSHRLGLVVGEADAGALEEPAATLGIPVVALLAEMGFGLDVLVEDEPSGPTIRRVARLLEATDGASAEPFLGLGELRDALRRSSADAFLSNFTFDWRLTEAGKSRLSFADLERGLAGGLRTLERLLARCRTPFFKRYSRYLRRSKVAAAAPSAPRAKDGSQ